jgi:hypothetical protein
VSRRARYSQWYASDLAAGKIAEISKWSLAVLRLSIVVLEQTEVTMLVTLVAILCNGPLCLEKVVTNSDQSGITMMACQVNAQMGIAEWLANGPYHEWTLKGYKCVVGQYTPKHDA